MMKTFCDICGSEVDEKSVNIDINCYGVSGFWPHEWNVCNACAQVPITVTLPRQKGGGCICLQGDVRNNACHALGCSVGGEVGDST